MKKANKTKKSCLLNISCITSVWIVAFLVVIFGASCFGEGQHLNPFTQEGNWYKAALHVHSTTSDGDVPVSERIAQYRKEGFDIVAITDHWQTNIIDGLSDDKFLVINSMEAHPKSKTETPNHFVCLNLPDGFQINRDLQAQQVIDTVKKAGGEVIYAHPYWSGHTLDDMLSVDGYIAVEVYNGVCEVAVSRGYGNVNWDQMLNKGNIISAVATDDIHNSENIGLGWIMIKAKELRIDEVMNSLRTGNFYASCGPEIKDFKVENGIVSIKCSPAQVILFNGQNSVGHRINAQDKQTLTTAQWKLPGHCRFVRAEIIDPNGKHAWTNPIVLK